MLRPEQPQRAAVSQVGPMLEVLVGLADGLRDLRALFLDRKSNV